MGRHCYIIIFLLFACAKSPFESTVAEYIAKADTTFTALSSISVTEEMNEEETRSHFEKRIEEEEARLTEQYLAYANEPCVLRYDSITEVLTLKDWNRLKTEVDSVKKKLKPYSKAISAHRRCLDYLNAKNEMIKNNRQRLTQESSINYYRHVISQKTHYSRVSATYLSNAGEKHVSIVIKVSGQDTLIYEASGNLAQFLSPFLYPPKLLNKVNTEEVAALRSIGYGCDYNSMEIVKLKGKEIVEAPYEETSAYRYDHHPKARNDYHQGILVVVDTTQTISTRPGFGSFQAYPIFFYNLTDKPIRFRWLKHTQQALDENGVWRCIEAIPSNEMFFDAPEAYQINSGSFGICNVTKYQGDFKTKLRVKFKDDDFIFYSQPYTGYINKNQFNFSPTQTTNKNFSNKFENDGYYLDEQGFRYTIAY